MSPLRLNGSTSGAVTLDCPAVGGNNTLVLPTGNGNAGNVLSTNGSGALSWANGGKILQVAQGFKTDTYSTTSTSFADVSGLSVTMTPASTSSKFLIMVNMTYLATFFVAHLRLMRNTTEIGNADTAGSRPTFFLNYSNTTQANADGAWVRESMDFLDSPNTTSAITYKLQASARRDGQGGTFYINRCFPDRDTSGYDGRGVSSIVVMEVAA